MRTHQASGNSEKVGLLVLQSTSFCNINCSYCYLPAEQRSSKNRMGEDVLRAVASKIVQSDHASDNLRILWHCGEPLVCSRDYYRSAISILESSRRSDQKLELTVQTNATLVDESWCAFFREHNFSVGVSIDGPAFLHDANRKTRTGLTTHDDVLRGAKLLMNRQVRTGAICVVSRATLRYPNELFSFFESNGFDYVGLNVEEIEGYNRNTSLAGVDSDDDGTIYEQARSFYSKLFRAWVSHGCKPIIREFATAVSRISAARRDSSFFPRAEEAVLGAIVSVSTSGEVSTFSPELSGQTSKAYNNFVVGNIFESSLSDHLTSLRARSLQAEIGAGIERCALDCSYFRLCGGEFVSNKYSEHGTFDASFTNACGFSRRALLDSVLAELT